MPHNDVDNLLRQRRFEPPSPQLGRRIAMAAMPVTRAPWWEAFSELLLPKPAFALALTLAIGFAVGLEAPAADDTFDTAGDFLSYEGDVL